MRHTIVGTDPDEIRPLDSEHKVRRENRKIDLDQPLALREYTRRSPTQRVAVLTKEEIETLPHRTG